MKITFLLPLLSLACVDPPSTEPGSNEPNGAAVPGAPGPGQSAGPSAAMAGGPPGAGPVVPPPGPDTPTTPTPMALQQDEIEGVTVSGTISCDDCAGPFLVRVDDAVADPPYLITEVSFAEAGPYTIKVPKDTKIVLMVVHDENEDALPSPGEKFGLWTGGLLDTSADATDILLTVGIIPDTPPIQPTGAFEGEEEGVQE